MHVEVSQRGSPGPQPDAAGTLAGTDALRLRVRQLLLNPEGTLMMMPFVMQVQYAWSPANAVLHRSRSGSWKACRIHIQASLVDYAEQRVLVQVS